MQNLNKQFLFFMLTLAITLNIFPTFATNQVITITPNYVSGVTSNQDAEMIFTAQNTNTQPQQAYFITALYNSSTNEMITYNYVSQLLDSNQIFTWGSCIPIPESGQYHIKVFAWDSMENQNLLSNIVEITENTAPQELDYKTILDATTNYLLTQKPLPLQTVGGEWSIFGVNRSNQTINNTYLDTYYDAVITEFENQLNQTQPFSGKVTEVQRLALALTSMGKDVTDFNGYNLLDFTWNKDKYFDMLSSEQQTLGGRQGINELIFGLLNLDMIDAPTPENTSISKDEIINLILNEYQLAGGGFSISNTSKTLDIDITAMTIQALAPYYDNNNNVKSAIDNALSILSNAQLSTGGFSYNNSTETSETTAQVIVALTSLGINPHEDSRFIKNGHTPITNLLSYYVGNGQFSHILDKDFDLMATEQSHYALVSYERLLENQTSLYNMRDVNIDHSTESTGTITLSIEKRTIGKGDTLSISDLEFTIGQTAWDIIYQEATKHNLDMTYTDIYGGIYIQSINGDGEFDYGPQSGWLYYINNDMPMVALDEYTLANNDTLRLIYSIDYSFDISTPLVEVLKNYISDAQKYSSTGYTTTSFANLQTAINNAQTIANDSSYNSTETEIELVVSNYINQIISAINNLEFTLSNVPSDIPSDFENDISLNADFVHLQNIGDTFEIYARRVPEIVSSSVSNAVTHPNYNYEIIRGNSVTVDNTGKVTAIQNGISIIEVTYDAITAFGTTYGAISEINKGILVVNVSDIDTGININLTNKLDGAVTESRSYDTYYYTNDYFEYPFTISATNSNSIEVRVNYEIIEPINGIYTAKLQNRSNIIEINASNELGTETFAKVIDARKIEIDIINLTNPDNMITVDDEVQINFNGITPAIYKLAGIYNPSFGSSALSSDIAGSKVVYNNNFLGELLGKNTQWFLATDNAITFTATEVGTYNFTNGHIRQGWWGEELGMDKIITVAEPNLSANHNWDIFSYLPDFNFEVVENIEVPDETEVARANLKALVNEMRPLWLTYGDGYTTASWAKFDNAFLAASSLTANLSATADRMNTAYTNLEDAFDNLELDATTEFLEAKNNLLSAITTTQSIYIAGNTQYTTDSWQNFDTAYLNAVEIYEKETSTIVQMEEATTTLENAFDSLTLDETVIARANLKALVDEMRPLWLTYGDGYTTASWATFDKAFLSASSLTVNLSATADRMNTAYTNLEDAFNNLILE
ncbi:MAG: hypothetical protein ATN36_03635 [Epulopiscium sp. Nele67-Bin005]|nr:MAG: hypothetical protein ATN36_03635 [Epulopiscium sp. Nele67-Bin005]